ncbi:hypothetical protein BASA50_006826 [Batrachochytrium salamandrivorans]|uniref:Radical SAM core domain-containing protein n=1 Tax=Batrachochytrium salamandrivorans TaxID=1357716 RepID=A0ABQ8F8N0_9FUNG|nr:hypothetical protein BASA62_008072 [Batrachochytrium salamandrivorans]KAH6574812.1 hypothetical protein BASA60_005281 [Batrachochytrium salamandrivorans]KAH6594129.1 hypothetical protein BASA50_006826 [Batrachochytrium salamandrivorans]KAH6601708.1 hypothetical protein BASA61_001912 [Batrachochytrium salamandrivorans]
MLSAVYRRPAWSDTFATVISKSLPPPSLLLLQTPSFISATVAIRRHSSDAMKLRVRQRIHAADVALLKHPLRDTFQRNHTYLRISLTERCNLRCTYCMPEHGVDLSPASALLTTDEIIRLATLFVDQGITKIRLTGGEPTVRKDLLEIVARLNALKPRGLQSIGMTTNGIALKRKLPALFENGLNQLNISLDTLHVDRFEELTRRKGLDAVMDAINTAAHMPFQAVKLNSVVVRNTNDDEIVDFVRLTKDLPIYVRFIEYMPFGGNKWDVEKFISYKEMLALVHREFGTLTKIQDDPNDTSKAYQVEGFKGTFGFITSMSEHFCGVCNRLRLLADGNMKVCLFGNSEVNLRDSLRRGASDDELMQLVGMAVHRKKKQHAATISGALHTVSCKDLPYQEPTHKSAISRDSSYYRWLSRPSYPPLPPHLTEFPPSFYNTPIAYKYNPHRAFSTTIIGSGQSKLTHIDEDGRALMVDVSDKMETKRTAIASACVLLGKEAYELVRDNKSSKGDVLTVAQIAGIQAAKQTSNLIPLCHPLMLTKIKLSLELHEPTHAVHISALASCTGKTGVEMEAMVAASIAACTVYDMCKAINKGIVISDVRLISKSGGKSGVYGKCDG